MPASAAVVSESSDLASRLLNVAPPSRDVAPPLGNVVPISADVAPCSKSVAPLSRHLEPEPREVVPTYADDGGEEAEIAGVYLISSDGSPRRLGMAIGNEFSDHRFEKKNYLNLAGSKIRTCSLGPELVVDPDFTSVSGRATIERAGQKIWTKEISTGEAEMCHSLQNIEHHHFKYEGHRRPGDLHVHYYGAHSLSFGDGVQLAQGDRMIVEFSGFGRALQNPLQVESPPDRLISASSLA